MRGLRHIAHNFEIELLEARSRDAFIPTGAMYTIGRFCCVEVFLGWRGASRVDKLGCRDTPRETRGARATHKRNNDCGDGDDGGGVDEAYGLKRRFALRLSTQQLVAHLSRLMIWVFSRSSFCQ